MQYPIDKPWSHFKSLNDRELWKLDSFLWNGGGEIFFSFGDPCTVSVKMETSEILI